MNFVKRLIYSILSIQEHFLMLGLSKTVGIKNKNKRKKYYTNGCFTTFETLADNEKQKMEDEILLILKNCNYKVDNIIEYIKKQNTDVYYIDNAKYIKVIGENEGFIYPQGNGKAIYLSLLTQQKIKLKTEEIFIFTKNPMDLYLLVYHFYNWYAFKHNIEGMDTKSQELLKKYIYNSSDEEINKLQLAEIYQLRDAIKQDKASIEFVFNLCKKLESEKKALNKLTENGHINL